ncbi:MAG: molybdate ABC transporter substrate-binding protein [Bacteroidales bacterium]|nr:molybdate ABC transporter substrate-binding protein [Bacteroidales bacterium]
MKKTALTLVLSLLVVIASATNPIPKITIAVAANMQFAMRALTQTFAKETGIECDLIISSSGKLTAQIKAGAPYDVFVSADMKYPDNLYKAGFALEEPKIYAYGKLVLWSINDSIKPSLAILKTDAIKHIACANPKTAPYGVAAIQALKHFGVYNLVENKLVYGESISQTNQFIISESAELGFTAKSVVLSPDFKGSGNWIEIDPNSYSPIAQGVIVIKRNKPEESKALKFYNFLFSPEAKKILENFGYKVK